MENEEARVEVQNTDKSIVFTFNDERIAEERQLIELEGTILPLLDEAAGKAVVMNLVNVRFASTIFLAFLIRVYKKVCEVGGRVELCNLHPNTLRVLETTNLTKVFAISPSPQ
jgi:anti-sigma B factor antagonist